MNTQEWLEANTEYLSASLAWLRQKLDDFAKSESAQELNIPAQVGASQAGASPSFLQQLFNRPVAEPLVTEATPSASQPAGNVQDTVPELLAKRNEAAEINPPPALKMLAENLGLTDFEQDVLLLCAAVELDTRIADLCARAQGDPQLTYPTFALALALFDDPVWDALTPDRPLRYWRLLEINQPGAQPLTTSALRADERIVNYLKGLNTLDDRLTAFLTPLSMILMVPEQLPPSQQLAADDIVRRWQTNSGVVQLPIVQLLGPDLLSKQLVMGHASELLGLHAFILTSETLPTQFGDLETLARLWQRESMLHPCALFLDAQEVDSGSPDLLAAIQRFLTRTDGVIFLSTRENWTRLGRANFSVDVERPTTAEQQKLWETALGDESKSIARRLAAQFDLNMTTISDVVQQSQLEPGESNEARERNLWITCSTITRPRLDALAQRIEPKATWEHLVLPAEQAKLLHQIAYQVGDRQTVYEDWGFAERMNRGLGISALFAGESGTGKTMAAEVVANELNLNLYRIDLSAVVSKYIGETEKNLRRLFDAAEDGGAILFFDEADAMFGKRSEVKDSHDRYANIEVNYLLQRMEAYRGLAILATNMKNALDPAFMRRLRFVVNFPFPGPNERKLIWKKVFPPRVPLGDLDYDRLARFNITGGNIHSIALNAAFTAARVDSTVNMPILFSAIRTEYRKLEKPINESEFVWKEEKQMADPVAIMTAISLGLKIVDEFRDLAIKVTSGEKAEPPGTIAEKEGETIQFKSGGEVIQKIAAKDMHLNEWDDKRYTTLEKRVKANWTIYNDLDAEIPILSVDERVRIKLRMETIQGELCTDFREMIRIYENILGMHLPDHYSLYEVCN